MSTLPRVEVWKPVVGFEGLYEISDQGRVRSLDRIVYVIRADGEVSERFYRGRVLRPGPRPSGHLTVVIGGATHNVHTLVLTAFTGPRPFPDAQARHLNGDEKDNRVENLCWSTRAENTRDRKWHRSSVVYRLSPAQAAQIKERIQNGETHKRLAIEFGVARSTITAINAGRFHVDV